MFKEVKISEDLDNKESDGERLCQVEFKAFRAFKDCDTVGF
tara:strand:- start:260 stop:382 length:123 start_codon:yes stop_codon:yes gene_type:complete